MIFRIISFIKNFKKILIIGIIATLIFLWWSVSGEKVEGYKITRQDITRGITASGNVASAENTEIAPVVTATIEKLYVRNDTYVKEGQLLAVLEHGEAQARLDIAKARLAQSQANLQNLRTEPRIQQVQTARAKVKELEESIVTINQSLQRSEIALKDTESLEKRYKTLKESGAISERDYEEIRFKRLQIMEDVDTQKSQIKQAQQSLAQAKAQLSLTLAGTKIEQIKAAEDDVKAAKGTVEIAQSDLDDYYIRAPFDGYVVRNLKYTGDVVSPSTPVYKMTKLSSLRIIADVEENQLNKIKNGQKIYIIFDAYPDKVFEQKIINVYKQVDPATGTFVIKSLLKPQPGYEFVPGMSFDVTIVTGEVKNAVIIPSDYVYTEKEKDFVYVKSNGFAKKREVKLKNFDNGREIVIGGKLKEGEIIVKPLKDKKLKSGAKIRITSYQDNLKDNK